MRLPNVYQHVENFTGLSPLLFQKRLPFHEARGPMFGEEVARNQRTSLRAIPSFETSF